MFDAQTFVSDSVRQLATARARREVRKLASNPSGTKIASAFERALDGEVTPMQSKWLDRIEAVRTRQEADATTTVEIMDYGAGSAGDSRSEQEMNDGVKISKTIQQVTKASKPEFWARFLHELVSEYRPEIAIEMGTCLGVSACYQAAALELNGAGHLVTMEGAPSLADASQSNIDEVELAHRVEIVRGKFSDTLADTLERFNPVDYAFIDGHHDEAATVLYFQQMLPYLSDDAVVVFDDIDWTDGMKRAWTHLASHPRVGLSVDLRVVGICVLGGPVHSSYIPTKGL